MKFFNTQEDVLDIQLTQEGKRKLADGKFKPTYYAFFDADIVYDVSYAGDTELQNESVPRILTETPRLRTQYQREGAESNFKKLKNFRRTSKKINNETMDRSFQQMPLGTSTGNEYLPAWKVSLASGEIHNVESTHSASWGVSFIPQLSSSVLVKTRVEFDEELASDDPSSETDSISTGGRPIFNPEGTGEIGEQPQVYPDGTYLVTEQGSLLLDFAELNNAFGDENFDIEVFEVMTEKAGTETKEILRPLKFLTEESYSKKSDREISYEVKHPDTGHVGHYIVINVDGELDVDDLGKFSGRKAGIGAATSPYGNGDLSDFDPDDLKEPC